MILFQRYVGKKIAERRREKRERALRAVWGGPLTLLRSLRLGLWNVRLVWLKIKTTLRLGFL
jgi:hypothetical protein